MTRCASPCRTRTSCSVSREGFSPSAEDCTSAVAASPLTRIVPIVSFGAGTSPSPCLSATSHGRPARLDLLDQLRRQQVVAQALVVLRRRRLPEGLHDGVHALGVGRPAAAAADSPRAASESDERAAHGAEHRMARHVDRRTDPIVAALLSLLVAGPRGPGPLRGHPSHRPGHRQARRRRGRTAGGRRAVPGLHARSAAPDLPQRPHRAGRGPLGADGRRDAVGRLLHRDRRRRVGRDLLGPEAADALAYAAFGDHGTREFFTHVRFHKHEEEQIVVHLLVELPADDTPRSSRTRCSR